VSGPDALVELSAENLPLNTGSALLEHFRIDEDYSNAYAAWKRLGSPPQPAGDLYRELQKAGQLTALDSPQTLQVESGRLNFRLRLPRQAVSLLKVSWR